MNPQTQGDANPKASIKLSDFDYHLPEDLIAQTPTLDRDRSRLMVVDRKSGGIQNRVFRDLPDILGPNDLLVLNDTRVFRARLRGTRPNGSAVEALLIRQKGDHVWEVLLRPGRRVKISNRLVFEAGVLEAIVLEERRNALRLLEFEYQGDFWEHVERLGEVPLPPYIQRHSGAPASRDFDRYQTVYARHRGSIAAPTAGLHFTPEILARLPHCFLTLHVGYGTFKPVTTELVRDHRMEPEFYTVGEKAASTITAQLEAGRTVTAVGTTATRTLEHVAARHGSIRPEQGWTDLFIYPGYRFQAVGSLITNFHLPKSTLLLLVSAFAGPELIRECYRKAIESRYRFYSYGDAMLIL